MDAINTFLIFLGLKIAKAGNFDFNSQAGTGNFGFLKPLQSGFEQLYALIKAVAPWVAIVMGAFQLFKIVSAADDKSVQTAKQRLLWIAVGFIAIYFVPELVLSVAKAFGAVS